MILLANSATNFLSTISKFNWSTKTRHSHILRLGWRWRTLCCPLSLPLGRVFCLKGEEMKKPANPKPIGR